MEDVAGVVLVWPEVLMMAAAWVTAAFAALEFIATRYPEKCPSMVASAVNWSPSGLPPVARRTGGKPASLAGALTELIFSALWLGWLLLLPQHPFLLMGPGITFFYGHGIGAGPVLVQFYWWVVALTALQVLWHAVELMAGTWRRGRRVRKMVASVLGLAPLLVLLAGPHVYLVLTDPASAQESFAAGLEQANLWIYFGAVVVTAISAVTLAIEIVRMGVEAYRKRVMAGR